jgi:hypothetical protein
MLVPVGLLAMARWAQSLDVGKGVHPSVAASLDVIHVYHALALIALTTYLAGVVIAELGLSTYLGAANVDLRYTLYVVFLNPYKFDGWL